MGYRRHSAADAAALLDDLVATYADAYGVVPGEDTNVKAAAFRNRAARALEAPNFVLVTARTEDEVIGFAFGYSLRPDSAWWDGLDPAPSDGWADETGARTVVLAEIEVRQAWQGQGIGRRLHDLLLGERSEQRPPWPPVPRRMPPASVTKAGDGSGWV
jgi:GNAT superfamily N-acetyltransferase